MDKTDGSKRNRRTALWKRKNKRRKRKSIKMFEILREKERGIKIEDRHVRVIGRTTIDEK